MTVREGVFGGSLQVTPDADPWDTYCLILLWLWCGWLWVRTRPGATVQVAGDDTG
jgi:hypothetical protein